MSTLTHNQFRMLNQLADGQVPSSMNPERSLGALEGRGLVVKVEGAYAANARWGGVQGGVYRLTQKGLEALRSEAERKCKADIRNSQALCKSTLRWLKSVHVEEPKT